MSDNSRIDDLRRRVRKDPASIAFAQLAEELRRAGEHQEAIDTCRAGLEIHPGYLSARVTLGRALIELGQIDEAQIELSRVIESAPENLAAIRGLAEIYHRRGDLARALEQYRAALLLARNDPDLEETIADLSRQVEPAKAAEPGGLTMQHMQDELLKRAPRLEKGDGGRLPPAEVILEPARNLEQWGQVEAEQTPVPMSPASSHAAAVDVLPTPAPPQTPRSTQGTQSSVLSAISAHSAVGVLPPPDATLTAAADDRATRTVAALEQWLAAIHVSREERHA